MFFGISRRWSTVTETPRDRSASTCETVRQRASASKGRSPSKTLEALLSLTEDEVDAADVDFERLRRNGKDGS